MADDNNIKLGVEVDQASAKTAFDGVENAAAKSAKESANAFERAFAKQTHAIKAHIENSIMSAKDVAEKSAKESAAVFEASFKQSSSIFGNIIPDSFKADIKDIAASYYVLKEGVDDVTRAVKAFVDFAVRGENELKLDKKFEVLATQAGVVADVFKNDLKGAVSGLVDESALLEIASQAFVTIGNNAKALPQVLELARKSYEVFGGSIVENTEIISNAVFSGQTRQLKSIGILVDAQKVYKDYAAAINVSVNSLTDAQKQQALLNAVLEKGNDQFKNIKVSAETVGNTVERIKVQTTEALDALSISFVKTFGPTVINTINTFNAGIKGLSSIFTDTTTPLQGMQKELFVLQGELIKVGKGAAVAQADLFKFGFTYEEIMKIKGGETDVLTARIDELKNKIKETKDAAQQMRDESVASAREISAKLSAEATQGNVVAGPSDQEIAARQRLAETAKQLNAQILQDDLARMQTQFDAKMTEEGAEEIRRQQLVIAETQHQEQIAQIKQQYRDSNYSATEAYNQALLAAEAKHVGNISKIEATAANNKKKVENAQHKYTLDGMTSTLNTIATLQESNSKELVAIGKAAAIATATINTYKGISQALGAFPPPFSFAAAALVAAVGFANVANIASVGGGGGAGGGGGISGYNPGSSFGPAEDQKNTYVVEDAEAKTPTTNVSVNIQGNVLDNRESGLAIAKILEEQFADQGLMIRGIA